MVCGRLFAVVATLALGALQFVRADGVARMSIDRLALANGLAKRGMLDDAIVEYGKLLGEKTDFQDEVMFRLAEAKRKNGAKDEAKSLYGKVLKDFPLSRFAPYARLGYALLESGNARIEALKLLDNDGVAADLRQLALYHIGCELEKTNPYAAQNAFTRSMDLVKKTDTSYMASLHLAILLSSSEAEKDRKMAFAIFLDLSACPNRRIAEEAVYLSGMHNYRQKNWSNAVILFKKYVQEYPNGSHLQEVKLWLAWSYYLSGKFTEALAAVNEASLKDGKQAEEALYLKIITCRRLIMMDEAYKCCNEYIGRYPNGANLESVLLEKASLSFSANDYDAVLKLIATPRNWTARAIPQMYSYAYDAAYAKKDYALALKYAATVIAAKSTEYSARALYVAGLCEMRLGHDEEAIRYWSKALSEYADNPIMADVLNARARQYLRRNDGKNAAVDFEELTKRFPARDDAETEYWLALALRTSGETGEAERHFKKALEKNPATGLARDIKLQLVETVADKGLDDGGMATVRELLAGKAADTIRLSVVLSYGERSLKDAKFDDALVAANLLLRRATDEAWQQTAKSFEGMIRQAKGERDAAIACYNAALGAKAATEYGVKAAVNLGDIYSSLGKFDDADASYKKAVEISDTPQLTSIRAKAYANLAENEMKRGRPKEALGYWMTLATIFDDPVLTPLALEKAAQEYRAEGRIKDAEDLMAERKSRYGK